MTADGAGIYCENGSILVIKNTIISQNTASTDVFSPDYSYGGGLFTDWSEVTISNSIITDNNSDTGAGIYFFDANTFRVESSIIAQNVASEAGGGVNMENNSNGIINNCTISANSGGFGGGIECYKSSPTISSCVISGNQATYARGGGIDCYGSSPLISNCTISSNSAYNDVGGGINCEADTIPINPVGSKPSIENCIFENNSEFAIFEYDGYNNPGGDSDPTVKYNLFYNNEPDAVATYGDYWDYDVSYSYSGDPCVPPGYHIDDIGDGHAHDNTGGDPLFKMNGPEEITGSWTSVSYNVIKNKTTLTDSLASFTRRSLIGSLINPDTNQRRQAFIKGNNITKVKVVGDITSTAADGYGFVQSGDSYRLIDYHIPENSPCIEAADPGYVVSPNDMDIDYQPRIVGPRLDIGADEYAIIGDLNFNGWIEEFDIGLFVSRWLETGCSDYAGDNTNWCSGTDINRDTVVDFFDFGKIVENQ
jgi:parallel beta-helix repeat protein